MGAVKVWSISPFSLIGYLNGVTDMYNGHCGNLAAIYLQDNVRLRGFHELIFKMNKRVMIEKVEGGRSAAGNGDVLRECDLRLLFEATDFKCCWQSQRFHLVICGFRLGLRLTDNLNFSVGGVDEFLKHVDSHKLQTPFSKSNMPVMCRLSNTLEEFALERSADPRFCVIACLKRQKELVAQCPMQPINFVFRRFAGRSTFALARASDSIGDCCAAWVSQTLKRKLCWKALARSSLITRLCEVLPANHVAAHVKCQVQNLKNYDRGSVQEAQACAAVAAGYAVGGL